MIYTGHFVNRQTHNLPACLLWLLLATLILVVHPARAQQPFGNEWIRPGQPYLKFSVDQTRIYRVTYRDIAAADPAFLRTDPRRWQLFFRGQEVNIRITGQQDGVFDELDVVEFYGEPNDGAQDSLLYRPQQQLHPYQSLYTDQAAYFLTVHPAQAGKRMPEVALAATGLVAEPYHIEEKVRAFTSEYTFNNLKNVEPLLQQSYFEPGEGWSGALLPPDSTGIVSLDLPGRIDANWPVLVETMINGRDHSNHAVQVSLDGQPEPLTTFTFTGFTSQRYRQMINPVSLPNNTLTLRYKANRVGLYDYFSITYLTVSYPQTISMRGLRSKRFRIAPNLAGVARLAIPDAPADIAAYDITDKGACRYLPVRGGDVVVDVATAGRVLYVTNEPASPLSIRSVRFGTTMPASTDYLLLTHRSLRTSATAYAAYRASTAGGAYKPFIIEADSLYDQYNYGERSPLAVRRFAAHMLATTGVKYMLLLGRARSYPYDVKTTTDDWVPTIGYPGSDILLTAGLGGYPPNTPAIPTGRLNVTTNEQVLAYLDKVRQLENTMPNGLWRKQTVHITGGSTPDEATSFHADLSALNGIITNGLLGGRVHSIRKTDFTQPVQSVALAPLVNSGVGLITFMGHAGPTVTDMDFGFASQPQNGINNEVYPLMVFNGCGVGEIFSKFTTLSTDWLLAPQKGASLVLAHSYLSYQQPIVRYVNRLYSRLFTDPASLTMSFGRVQQLINHRQDQPGIDPYDISTQLSMVLQGDPALQLYPLAAPDYTVSPTGMYIQASVAGSAIKTSDSIRLVIPLANLGRYVAGQTIPFRLVQTIGSTTVVTPGQLPAFRYQDTVRFTLAKNELLRQIDLVIDPAGQLTELDTTNNTGTLPIDWARANTASSYPVNAQPDRVSPIVSVRVNGVLQKSQAVVGVSPQIDISLIDQNPLSASDTSLVTVYLTNCATCQPRKLPVSARSSIAHLANQAQFTTTPLLTKGMTYQLVVVGRDAAGNSTVPPYTLSLTVADETTPITLQTYPNPATTYVQFDLTANQPDAPVSAQLRLYDARGLLVHEYTMPVSTGLTPYTWQAALPGLYVYTMDVVWPAGTSQRISGKVMVRP